MSDYTTIDVNFIRPEGGTLEMRISENLSKKIERLLQGIVKRDYLKKIGPMMFAAIRKNFDVGGRPERWPVTKAIVNPKTGKARRGFKTLILTGNLKESIHPVLTEGDTLMFRVDAPYGVWHEQPTGFKSLRNVPQRRFLVIPPEDKADAIKVATEWLEAKIA